MSNVVNSDEDTQEHLKDLEDGAGCTEIWEKLSEQREETAKEEE